MTSTGIRKLLLAATCVLTALAAGACTHTRTSQSARPQPSWSENASPELLRIQKPVLDELQATVDALPDDATITEAFRGPSTVLECSPLGPDAGMQNSVIIKFTTGLSPQALSAAVGGKLVALGWTQDFELSTPGGGRGDTLDQGWYRTLTNDARATASLAVESGDLPSRKAFFIVSAPTAVCYPKSSPAPTTAG